MPKREDAHEKTDSVLFSINIFKDGKKDEKGQTEYQQGKSYLAAFLGFAAAVLADQITKYLAEIFFEKRRTCRDQ